MQGRRFLFSLVAVMALMIPSLPGSYGADVMAQFYQRTLPTPQEEMVALEDFRGQPLVINFWASWCPPCVEEMPDLDELAHALPQVQFIGLAVDTQKNVRKFQEKVSVSYPLLVVGHAGIEWMKEMGNPKAGVPYTLILDEEGNQVDKILGPVRQDALRKTLTTHFGP